MEICGLMKQNLKSQLSPSNYFYKQRSVKGELKFGYVAVSGTKTIQANVPDSVKKLEKLKCVGYYKKTVIQNIRQNQS